MADEQLDGTDMIGELLGVPVAGVQKTTLHTFVGNGAEENEGLRPRILWTETPCIFHV